jgi:putative oxygen-independent coproporphyrinogen III oxidase
MPARRVVVRPGRSSPEEPIGCGAYVHIPFCVHRCDYCAFATWTDRDHLMADYLDAVRTEVERAVAQGWSGVTSVFVGGGTPSRVPPRDLVAILDALPRREGCETTIECNPDDVDVEMMRIYADHGVTRISLGVQSMVPEVLATLGRTHDPANVVSAVNAIREAGIPTFNLDVIYGAAGETLAQWRTTLEAILALDPPHVSAYGLTVEAGTPLATDPRRHPDDDDQADKYELADELLEASGRPWYEVSNWARPGHECRHNLLTWAQGDYRGFGCAAHSHERGRRWWNLRTPERYVAAIRDHRSPEAAGERVVGGELLLEARQLALRTRNGVTADAFDPDVLSDLVEPAELVVRQEDRIVLTRAGRLLANEVSLRLLDC